MTSCNIADPAELDAAALEWAQGRADEALRQMSKAAQAGKDSLVKFDAAQSSVERAKYLREFRQTVQDWEAARDALAVANDAIRAIQEALARFSSPTSRGGQFRPLRRSGAAHRQPAAATTPQAVRALRFRTEPASVFFLARW